MGYWSAGPPPGTLDMLLEAERLGYDSVWTAEAYGSDALTPLAWYGSHTSRIKLGTGICQMPARTPTALGMAAMTLDHLSEGRLLLGVGASGPQVVEGWYGQPYPKPLARSREYIDIVRKTVARDQPVSFAGDHYRLPYAGGTGLGKALKSTIHPRRREIPIYLGAEGPKNIALAAEIADGWVAMLYSPKDDAWYRERLAEGFAKRSPERSPVESFEVVCLTPAVINPDVEAAADMIRPYLALYAGGMAPAAPTSTSKRSPGPASRRKRRRFRSCTWPATRRTRSPPSRPKWSRPWRSSGRPRRSATISRRGRRAS